MSTPSAQVANTSRAAFCGMRRSPSDGHHFAPRTPDHIRERLLDNATLEAVRFRCEQRLGHLGEVKVEPFDHNWFFGVALSLHNRAGEWRHAVWGNKAIEDPVMLADEASDRLLVWYRKRAGRQDAE
jgi:hypothetical protein